MSDIKIVSDSSFFIFFIDDVKRPDLLLKVIQDCSFTFVIGPVVDSEISSSSNLSPIQEHFYGDITKFDYYSYGEILRPFFSLREIEKGEHEVTAISFILFYKEVPFRAVVDEISHREFLRKRFPMVYRNMVGTIGFIICCTEEGKVFSVEEAIRLLKLAKASKFRIDERILDDAIEKLGG